MGEVLASRALRDKGYEIIAANYSVRGGEIDIVACKDGNYIFVEVKSRTGETLFSPAEAVDRSKSERVKTAAAAFITANKIIAEPQFDIIEVIFERSEHKISGDDFRINHIANAF